MMTTKRHHCRFCGHRLPAWVPVAKARGHAPSGVVQELLWQALPLGNATPRPEG